jgi:DNA topoisomerase II
MAQINQIPDSVTITKRSVNSFLNNEVKDAAKYIVETRALPNIMDGLRPGARKIIWAAMSGDLKNSTKVKLPSLIGDTFKLHFNHGDAALYNTVVQLSSKHVMKFAPLDIIGQIGTLRVPKCKTATRYLHVRKSKYMDFYKTDMELVEFLIEDGDLVEPKFFLPILPQTLLYRTNSPGFGFSFRSFSYDINSIIDNCIKAITNGSCNLDADTIPLVPFVEGIKPENMIYNANKDSWYCVGEYEMNFERDQLIIKDLPFDIALDKFDLHLHELIEKNYIISFTDLSQDDNIKYIINFAKGRLKLLSQDQFKFFGTMKLYSKVIKNTLNCIDTDGSTILFFDTPYELIDSFIKKRLEYYQKRKVRTISVLNKDIQDITDKIKFINLIITDQLIINKRLIVDVKLDMDKFNLPHELLKLSVGSLTQDEIDKLETKKKEFEAYLQYIKITSIQEMYINDLINFKEKYCTINKK